MIDLPIHLQMLVVAFAGALIGLDRTAAGQFMISQPIVAAPLIGWMTGDAAAGLIIGAVLELLWVLDMPVGTFVPADTTIAAVSATAAATLATRGDVSVPVLGFCVLLSVGAGPLTMQADRVIRKWNAALPETGFARAGRDAGQRISRAHLAGLALFFLKSFAVYLVLLPAGYAAVTLFSATPEPVHRSMELFLRLMPFLGAGLAASRLSIRIADPFLLAGFATGALFGLALQLPFWTIMAVSVFAAWLGVRWATLRGM